MLTHALITALDPRFGTDTLCQYGPENRQNCFQGSRNLDKVNCPDCLAEMEKRMPKSRSMTGMDIL